METVKCDSWPAKTTDIFQELICERKKMVFDITEANHGGRYFGRLLLYSDNDNDSVCMAEHLCEVNGAMKSSDYLNGESKCDFIDFICCCVEKVLHLDCGFRTIVCL